MILGGQRSFKCSQTKPSRPATRSEDVSVAWQAIQRPFLGLQRLWQQTWNIVNAPELEERVNKRLIMTTLLDNFDHYAPELDFEHRVENFSKSSFNQMPQDLLSLLNFVNFTADRNHLAFLTVLFLLVRNPALF